MSKAGFLVVVLDDGYWNYDTERRILADAGATLQVRDCAGDAARVAEALTDAHAALVRESPITAEAIAGMREGRVIVRYGIGVDNIALQAAKARDIVVANVPDYGTEEVSDQALALTMAVARRVVTRDREVRAGAWNIGPAQKMYRLAGKTLGLIGYGRIARAFERKMRGVGVTRVLVHDPYASLPADVEAASVDEICQQADLVSLHSPLTPQTRHVLDARRIAMLKPTAIVVNTSRGPLIDEAALCEALAERRIFGAGLDVFEKEPPDIHAAVLKLDNLVVSDHTGWYSEEAIQDLQRKAAEEVARVLRGEPALNRVNA